MLRSGQCGRPVLQQAAAASLREECKESQAEYSGMREEAAAAAYEPLSWYLCKCAALCVCVCVTR